MAIVWLFDVRLTPRRELPRLTVVFGRPGRYNQPFRANEQFLSPRNAFRLQPRVPEFLPAAPPLTPTSIPPFPIDKSPTISGCPSSSPPELSIENLNGAQSVPFFLCPASRVQGNILHPMPSLENFDCLSTVLEVFYPPTKASTSSFYIDPPHQHGRLLFSHSVLSVLRLVDTSYMLQT